MLKHLILSGRFSKDQAFEVRCFSWTLFFLPLWAFLSLSHFCSSFFLDILGLLLLHRRNMLEGITVFSTCSNSHILHRRVGEVGQCHSRPCSNYYIFQLDVSFLVMFGLGSGDRVRCSGYSWDCFERHPSFFRHFSILSHSTPETFIPFLSLCGVSLQLVTSQCCVPLKEPLCGGRHTFLFVTVIHWSCASRARFGFVTFSLGRVFKLKEYETQNLVHPFI